MFLISAGIILYTLIGIFWGLYAIGKQITIYPYSSERKIIFVGLLNCIIWPISMLVALIRKITGKTL